VNPWLSGGGSLKMWGKYRNEPLNLVDEAVMMPLIFRLQPDIWLINPSLCDVSSHLNPEVQSALIRIISESVSYRCFR